MPTDHRAKLATIKRFDQLIAYLRDDMGWPIARDSFEEVDDLFYDFTADELGIDPKTAAKIQEIKRLRPLSPRQPWGIFFVKFEPKKLPVVALRRILSQVALKRRASANSAERAAWAADDLLFVSNYGEGDERQISFAHFSRAQDGHDLPTLKVLGWDNFDTPLHLDAVARELTEHLAWPDDDGNADAWRTRWRAAFTLRHREVVTTSKELSIRLAELARNIRDRIKTALAIETDKGPLTRLMKAFQEALVHDLDADGFADMYAQTIAYGLLSARIADPHKRTADDFAAHMRTNPFLRELMETFLKIGGRRGKAGGPGIDFDELGVSEVVELLDDANMEAVVRDFGDRNPQEDPVIHFYELFLKEYDAKKRMQRGVFYTPRPVVSYIVRSVNELLRTEFGLEDGLADTATWAEMEQRHNDLKIPEGVSPDQDFVQILDPATGTGTFLVEVIDLIHKTLVAKWKAQGHGERKIDALWNEYVPKHLLTRLHGYELLMAPYAIAHLKIGLKLYETGYRFGSDERARVYLTNALEPAQDFSGRFEFAISALAHEAQAVNEIKRHRRFTVVIGNPPYSSAAGATHTAFLADIMRTFTTGLGVESERKKGALQDDYVRFIALCRHIIARAGVGSVGLITNNSYLDGTLHRAMRKSLLDALQRLLLLNLHGSSRVGARGAEDENVFDIMQGVAILIGARPWESGLANPSTAPWIRYADLVGARVAKYANLAAGIVKPSELHPAPPYYLLRPLDRSLFAEYEAHVAVDEAFGVFSSGIETEKDHFAVDFSIEPLRRRLREFCDLSVSAKEVAGTFGLKSTPNWDLVESRKALAKEGLSKDLFTRYLFHCFDWRYTYYSDHLVTRSRRPVMRHMFGKNVALVTLRQVKGEPWAHAFVTADISNKFTLSSKSSNVSYHFPLFLMEDRSKAPTLLENPPAQSNLSATVVDRFTEPSATGRGTPIHMGTRTRHAFNYIYAVLHSPAYRVRYAEYLRLGFPRVPVTENLGLRRALAQFGEDLTSLHVLESHKLTKPITEFVGVRNFEVEKISWSKNTVWLDKAFTIGFRGVREEVWNFHIGGYQVCEKWLKDRKGRALSMDDIAHYQKIVVALAETIRLMKEIDKVIDQYGGWPGAFQTGEAEAATAKVIPFRPRTIDPKPEERYVNCVPLVPLKAAAGAFGDPQHIEDEGFQWVAVESRHRLRKGMFIAQVVGKSMESAIPDGAFCLFRAPVEGTRQGKTVLVQLRDATDPETDQRYTVKRYERGKAAKGDNWRLERITLKPLNPDFEPIVLTAKDEGELQVIAELVEVLGSEE